MEGFFSGFKRLFGEYVSSVRFENIKKELLFKVAIANMFLAMGWDRRYDRTVVNWDLVSGEVLQEILLDTAPEGIG